MNTVAKRKYSRMVMLSLAVFLLFAVTTVKMAYGASVTVKLPDFAVTINGKVIDNNKRVYPLIVYKDITYVPMTWYDCRFLGLESDWNQASGLTIKNTNIVGSYYEDTVAGVNAGTYTAQIPTFNITVNEKAIDNSLEPYPLLSFRNVTYFPLTWRFAVDEFAWSYEYTELAGLIIDRGQSGQALSMNSMTVKLPVANRDYYDYSKNYIAVGGYFYYEGAQGKIYQAPISNPTAFKEIYQLPMDEIYFRDYPFPILETKNDEAFMFYHFGGAVMGTQYYFKLNADGTVEETYPDKDMTFHGNLQVRVATINGPPINDNLSVKLPGQTEYQSIGDASHVYLKSGEENVYVNGENIYVRANPEYSQGNSGWPGDEYIYAVNMYTGQPVRIYEQPVKAMAVKVDQIYFIGHDDHLYQMSLSAQNVHKVMDEKALDFRLVGDDIYYIMSVGDESGSGSLKRLSDGQVINPSGNAYDLEVQDGYLYCRYEVIEGESNKYAKVIINPEGQIIYQSGDLNDKVLIYDHQMIYIE